MRTENEIKDYIEKLHQQGVGRYTAAPPLNRLLWKIGLNVPPPLSRGFWLNFFITGTLFAIFYPLVVWMIKNLFKPWDSSVTVFEAVFIGVLFGSFFAGWNRWKSKKLDIPEW